MSTVLTCSNIKARFSQPSLNYIAPARILFHLNIVTLRDAQERGAIKTVSPIASQRIKQRE